MPYKKDIEAQRKCVRKHYNNNKQYYIEKAKEYRNKLRDLIQDSKKEGCTKCGEKHIACLEFHHLDPNTKEHNVSNLINQGSKKRVLEEISKCIVLCANCHRKLHYKGH